MITRPTQNDREVHIELACIDCSFATTTPFPACLDELEAHDCEEAA